MGEAAHKLQAINETCYCYPIARKQVETTILEMSPHRDMPSLLDDRPHYFANTAVFLSPRQYDEILEQIAAIEATIQSPEFQAEIFAREDNPPLHYQPATCGAFMGYDFHITSEGARLIEINSNAGGAFIVNALEHAAVKPSKTVLDAIADMFVREWRLAGRMARPRTVAIIDEKPSEQFHYPDMLLAAESLRERGFTVFIADPSELSYVRSDDNIREVKIGEMPVDLIYNRLTDFTLQSSQNRDLRDALMADAVIMTPAPRHHALYADKRNLVALSQAIPDIPETVKVDADNHDRLWRDRKQYYFKPYAGFGGRGTYRGAKLTTKVWEQIKQGGYIAQKLVTPPKRAVLRSTDRAELKYDLRVYVYDGQPLLLGARVYQGQTTNLRTEGGGLAPVILLSDAARDACYDNLPLMDAGHFK